MATNSVTICNRALWKIGAIENPLTSLSADETKEDRVCNAVYSDLLEETLRLWPWPFTKKVSQLVLTSGYPEYDTVAGRDPVTVSSITKGTTTTVTTASAHGWSTGDRVEFSTTVSGMTELINNYDGIYTITSTGASTFTLDGIDSTNWTDYVASSGTVSLSPVLSRYDSGYVYDLPSDCIIPLHLDQKDRDYQIIGTKLYSTIDSAKLVYISSVTTTTLFERLFEEVLISRIAYEIVIPLMGSGQEAQGVRNAMIVEYEKSRNKAEMIFANMEQGQEGYTDTWLSSR